MAFHWLNDASRQFLERGYLSDGQTAEERIADIAKHAEVLTGIKGFGEKFYRYMGQGYYSLSSPVWANYGTARGLPVSCFGSYVDDNIPSIMEGVSEVGAMSKFGGGCSGYFGSVRPRGADIGEGNGKTFGAVHFMELFETLTSVVSQGTVRRGFFSPYLPIDHGDVEEFIDIGSEGHPIQGLTHGVTVTDDWMKSMIAGDMDKRQVWAKVLQSRKEKGYPYIVFKDNVNNNKPEVYKDLGMDIVASNMCVAPETKVLTDTGWHEIKSLAGKSVPVWNGFEFSEAQVEKTGSNQELTKVTTDSGHVLECTDYHKWYVVRGGVETEVQTKDLEVGDKLIKHGLPVIGEMDYLDMHHYTQGFYSGDGCKVKNKARIYLYGEKRKLFEAFEIEKGATVTVQDDRIYFNAEVLDTDKSFVPVNSKYIDHKLDWLAGWLDADGSVHWNNESCSLVGASVDLEFIKNVQLMLQTLGVNAKIKKMRDEGEYDLPANDGTGENKKYFCKTTYRILINSNGIKTLFALGYKPQRLSFDGMKEPNRNAARFVRIESIENTGRIDDTYCFNEPKRHMGMFNGILTGQCSEIALPSSPDESFVCVLSSMNIEKYDEWKKTDAVETLAIFLDSVVEEFLSRLDDMLYEGGKEGADMFELMKRAYDFAVKHRAIGIGTLGWHSYLQKNHIAFESSDAARLNVEIHKTISERAHKASQELARTKGEPTYLKGYGRRNTTLTAIAPTKSSSFILGQVSQGIEPEFSNFYIKDLAKARVTVKNKYLEELLDFYGRNDKETWDSIQDRDGSVQHLPFMTDQDKAVFKTFSEINPTAIINQAAARQPYVDQSQSLNLMIHPEISVKDINQLYINAWKMGVKSLYYQFSTNAAQDFARKMNILECEACEA